MIERWGDEDPQDPGEFLLYALVLLGLAGIIGAVAWVIGSMN